MCKKLIMILVVAAISAMLYAQDSSKPPAAKLGRGVPTRIYNINRPVSVTGNGMSTPSGVKYWDLQIGKGKAAERGHVVSMLYREWVKDGKEIGSSISLSKPTIFTLGVGQVIKGWEDGVEGMKAGGKRQIRIPPDLAYGSEGVPPDVPPSATLVLDIELLDVQ